MRRGHTKKRRLAVAAIFALTVAVTAPLLAPSAGALVANPGVLDIAMNLTVSTPSFTVAGMRTTGLGAATMEKNGLITIPKSSLRFDPVVVPIDLPQPPPDPAAPAPGPAPTTATVRAVATSDFTGGLDPGNGAAFILGDIQEVWTQTGTMTSCVVGPFHVAARTNAQGAVGYSAKTGTVSMVDPDPTVDAVPVSAPGCGGLEGSVNTALSLPVTTTTTTTNPLASTTTTTIPLNADPPIPSIVVALTFMPAPLAVSLPPVTRPHQPQTPPPSNGPNPGPTATSPGIVYVPTPGGPAPQQPRRPHRSYSARSSRNRNNHSSYDTYRTRRRVGAGWSTNVVRRRPSHPSHASAHRPAATSKAKSTHQTASVGSQTLKFTNAAFINRPKSALATALDLVGLLGLLGFSSLALWLVTTELSEFSAVSRRLRTHRIAGISK